MQIVLCAMASCGDSDELGDSIAVMTGPYTVFWSAAVQLDAALNHFELAATRPFLAWLCVPFEKARYLATAEWRLNPLTSFVPDAFLYAVW